MVINIDNEAFRNYIFNLPKANSRYDTIELLKENKPFIMKDRQERTLRMKLGSEGEVNAYGILDVYSPEHKVVIPFGSQGVDELALWDLHFERLMRGGLMNLQSKIEAITKDIFRTEFGKDEEDISNERILYRIAVLKRQGLDFIKDMPYKFESIWWSDISNR